MRLQRDAIVDHDKSTSVCGPTIAVIVATRNEEAHIERCLTSLMTQDRVTDAAGNSVRVEIILVDGQSEDKTRDRVISAAASNGWQLSIGSADRPTHAEDRSIRLLENPDRTTPHAFNRGIDAAPHADYLVVFGAHSHAQPHYLQSNLRALEERGADIVGGSLDIIGDGPTASAIALAQTSKVGTGGGAYREAGAEGWVDTVPFPFFRSSLISRIGNFDEDLIRNQDDEFIHRARQDGAKVWLDANISTPYVSRSSMQRLYRQYYDYGRYRIRTIKKRGEAGSARQLAPGLAAIAGMGVTAASLATRRPAIPIALGAGYAAIVAAEGARLAPSPKAAATTAAAIITQHGAYAMGQLHGIAELGRRSSR